MVLVTNKITDQVAEDLLKNIGKDDLVHILLDMINPRDVLKTIILTRAEQTRLEQEVSKNTGHRPYPCCWECKGIYKVLQEVLIKNQLNESDILCTNG